MDIFEKIKNLNKDELLKIILNNGDIYYGYFKNIKRKSNKIVLSLVWNLNKDTICPSQLNFVLSEIKEYKLASIEESETFEQAIKEYILS